MRLAVEELDAGHCNLSDEEVSQIFDIFAQARSRSAASTSSAKATELRRIEEGFVHLADKVERLDDEVESMKVVRMKKS